MPGGFHAPYPPEFKAEAVRLVREGGRTISDVAQSLGVTPESLRQWLKQADLDTGRRNERLKTLIAEIHRFSRGTYGAPRVRAELRFAHGMRCSEKRVARLMRLLGVHGVHRRRGRRTTVRSPEAAPAPDLVQRNFQASGPGQLLVADITYVPTWAGFLFLAVVVDTFSRVVAGWSMANHLRTELVLNALQMALRRRRIAPGAVHHSDQGSQPGLKGSTQRWPVEPRVGVRREPLLASSMRGSCAVDR